MDNCLVSFIVLTYNRKDELIQALKSIQSQSYHPKEIIVVDNGSTDGSSTLIKESFPSVKLIRLNNNVGVGRGKNIGIQNAQGDVLIFIDDDAFFVDRNSTKLIVNRLLSEENLGLIGCKIFNLPKNGIDRKEIPRRDKKIIEHEHETTYFVGTGFALKRKVIESVGLFPEDYFYSGEELDLSFRMIEAGFKIIYFPKVVVYHNVSPKGRPVWQRSYYLTRNRIWLALKYLPTHYAILHSTCWLAFMFYESMLRGFLRYYFRGVFDSIKGLLPILKCRKVLSTKTIRKLRLLSGRLYY